MPDEALSAIERNTDTPVSNASADGQAPAMAGGGTAVPNTSTAFKFIGVPLAAPSVVCPSTVC